jgi:hypothetical protein
MKHGDDTKFKKYGDYVSIKLFPSPQYSDWPCDTTSLLSNGYRGAISGRGSKRQMPVADRSTPPSAKVEKVGFLPPFLMS